MRKYSTERPSAKEFGGTMQTSPLNSTNDFGVEVLGVHDRGIHVGEDAEFIGDAHVVAVGRDAVADDAVADLAVFVRLDHFVFLRHFANPFIGLHRHLFLPEFW